MDGRLRSYATRPGRMGLCTWASPPVGGVGGALPSALWAAPGGGGGVLAGCTDGTIRGGRPTCPAANTVLVGGAEGQVEIYRACVVSHHRVEVRLVRRLAERHRRSPVEVLAVAPADGVVFAATAEGGVRRWRLSVADAAALVRRRPGAQGAEDDYDAASRGLPREAAAAVVVDVYGGGTAVADAVTAASTDGGASAAAAADAPARPPVTEANVVAAAALPPESTRLAAAADMVAAQKALAAVMAVGVGVAESAKDALVDAFQKKQAGVQAVVSTSDAELRVAVARVLSRYAAVLGDGDGGEADGEDARVLRRAARRTAAFEMDAVQTPTR
ncbi:hypothetical protein I4F81_005742 [Pyropia yezoensis]|uniref:Uncharacterized protein n=1 Tax=Pyropia yezoensis TaxID=2788 RepID=A0ACC3BZI8_PYRYE|nr:hypothetical protein I4F81_005742 [Neopyropia yezoensis]